MEYFAKLGTRHIGLFTLANSPKHVGLYQRFGFWPHTSTFVEYTMAYKYHNEQYIVLEMLCTVKQETIVTFSIMVFALASLFATGPGQENYSIFLCAVVMTTKTQCTLAYYLYVNKVYDFSNLAISNACEY